MEGDSDGNEDGLLNHDPQGSKGFDSLTLRLALLGANALACSEER